MGYALALGACCACTELMSFNPHKVPSVKINGVREPVCQRCVEEVNTRRRRLGLEEWAILPGAYEAMNEEEL